MNLRQMWPQAYLQSTRDRRVCPPRIYIPHFILQPIGITNPSPTNRTMAGCCSYSEMYVKRPLHWFASRSQCVYFVPKKKGLVACGWSILPLIGGFAMVGMESGLNIASYLCRTWIEVHETDVALILLEEIHHNRNRMWGKEGSRGYQRG